MPFSDEIQAYLHQHIPLSAAMQVQVLEASHRRVLLHAPLEPNLNHRDTAFGGSLATLGILAGWTLVHLGFREEGLHARTVIQESRVRYTAPVHTDFRAEALAPAPEAWSRFLASVARWNRGRISVSVALTTDVGDPVGSMEGTYVVLHP
ncbi:MAG: YiiD C-terminal domain-containing protein [Gemmatimonadota bacterium]